MHDSIKKAFTRTRILIHVQEVYFIINDDLNDWNNLWSWQMCDNIAHSDIRVVLKMHLKVSNLLFRLAFPIHKTRVKPERGKK